MGSVALDERVVDYIWKLLMGYATLDKRVVDYIWKLLMGYATLDKRVIDCIWFSGHSISAFTCECLHHIH